MSLLAYVRKRASLMPSVMLFQEQSNSCTREPALCAVETRACEEAAVSSLSSWAVTSMPGIAGNASMQAGC